MERGRRAECGKNMASKVIIIEWRNEECMAHRRIETKAEQNESRPWRHYATIIEARSTSQSRMRIEIVSFASSSLPPSLPPSLPAQSLTSQLIIATRVLFGNPSNVLRCRWPMFADVCRCMFHVKANIRVAVSISSRDDPTTRQLGR